MNPAKLYAKYFKNLSQFELARLRLTTLYLIIIMAVSILFSIATFRLQQNDLDTRFGRFQSFIHQYELFFPGRTLPQGIPDIDDALNQLKLNLFYLNIVILGLSSAAGYFLAGKTLRPIQRSLDDQARFVADASHEMRTPLTALKTSTEVALRDKNLSHKEISELLISNLKKINDLQNLTESLLSLARDGQVENAPLEPISLPQLIQDSVSKVADSAAQRNISINQNIPSFKIVGDPHSLTELFVILLDNAIKYNSEKTQVNLAARRVEQKIQIVVKDNGVGISPHDLPHIFDRFYRADVSRSKDVPGYGLGLSIAKKIIEANSGTIVAKSPRGGGAEFFVTLPSA